MQNCQPSEKLKSSERGSFMHLLRLLLNELLHQCGMAWRQSAWYYKAQVALIVAFSSSVLLGLVSFFFLLTIPHRLSMRFNQTPWSANQLLVVLALWAGAKSCWKKEICISIKLVSRWKHKVLYSLLVDG